MTTRIGFLRAVNVGSRRVPMARLVDVCEHLGFADVWTYANSGNVVFDAAGARQRIEHDIERALESEFGFEVTTFVRSARELAHAVELQPFEVSGNDTYFVTFFKSPLAATKAKELEAVSNDFDTLIVDGRDVHWRMHGKSTDTTVTSATWARFVGRHGSTSRNVSLLARVTAKLAA